MYQFSRINFYYFHVKMVFIFAPCSTRNYFWFFLEKWYHNTPWSTRVWTGWRKVAQQKYLRCKYKLTLSIGETSLIIKQNNLSLALTSVFVLALLGFSKSLILGFAWPPKQEWDGKAGQSHDSKCSPVQLELKKKWYEYSTCFQIQMNFKLGLGYLQHEGRISCRSHGRQ